MVKDFKNVREIIEYTKEKFPENIAFRVKQRINRKISYDDINYIRLAREVRAFGKYLIKNGYINERIAVIGKNSYEWMLVFLSVLSAGGVIVPLDRGLLDYEIKEQLERAEAKTVFYAEHLASSFEEIDGIKKVVFESEEFSDMLKEGLSLDNDVEYDSIKIDSNKMSILLFTSGTTQKSKAVMLSQKNITSNATALTEWENLYETDVNLAFLPFHHAFGMMQTVLFLSLGACNVFCEGLKIAKALNEYHVSVLVVVPLVLEKIKATVEKEIKKLGKDKTFNTGIKLSKLLRKVKIDVRRKLFKSVVDKLGGNLRLIISGAAALSPETARWFNDIGITLIQGYGLSETSPVVSAENDEHISYGSIGFPLPGVEVKIEDKDENGIGELIVRGDNVMLGYYKDEENTNAVLKNGWFSTGDMAYIDKDGYLFITGRKKNVIVLASGKNVFPEETEQLLNEAPIIKECIVYNKMRGDKDYLCAKIVYDNEVESDVEKAREMVQEHVNMVNSKLIKYKQIMDFDLTDVEMEKTTTGKIKRYAH